MEIIKVRRLEYEDLSSRVQWFNHPSTYDQVLFDIPFSLSATQEWYRKNVLNDSRKDFSFDLCIGSDLPKLIAFGGLVNIDYKNRKAERYFLLDPKMTGKGIGYNLLSWISNYGFIHLNLNKIYGLSLDGNEKILSVNTREGWSVDGKLRENVYHNGKYVDQYIKSILRCEWEKQPWKKEQLSFFIEIKEKVTKVRSDKEKLKI